jgi:hypothetical protein
MKKLKYKEEKILYKFHPMQRRYRQRQDHCQHHAGFVASVMNNS